MQALNTYPTKMLKVRLQKCLKCLGYLMSDTVNTVQSTITLEGHSPSAIPANARVSGDGSNAPHRQRSNVTKHVECH